MNILIKPFLEHLSPDLVTSFLFGWFTIGTMVFAAKRAHLDKWRSNKSWDNYLFAKDLFKFYPMIMGAAITAAMMLKNAFDKI